MIDIRREKTTPTGENIEISKNFYRNFLDKKLCSSHLSSLPEKRNNRIYSWHSRKEKGRETAAAAAAVKAMKTNIDQHYKFYCFLFHFFLGCFRCCFCCKFSNPGTRDTSTFTFCVEWMGWIFFMFVAIILQAIKHIFRHSIYLSSPIPQPIVLCSKTSYIKNSNWIFRSFRFLSCGWLQRHLSIDAALRFLVVVLSVKFFFVFFFTSIWQHFTVFTFPQSRININASDQNSGDLFFFLLFCNFATLSLGFFFFFFVLLLLLRNRCATFQIGLNHVESRK